MATQAIASAKAAMAIPKDGPYASADKIKKGLMLKAAFPACWI